MTDSISANYVTQGMTWSDFHLSRDTFLYFCCTLPDPVFEYDYGYFIQTRHFLVSHSFELKLHKHLPVVLYGYETWSPTLTVDHRLRVFENDGYLRRRKWQDNEEN